MKEPIWISEVAVFAIQEEMLVRFGGLAGIRDHGLLESALHRPIQLFNYGTPTLFELAAAYTFGIVRNHPFIDGNKRVGFMTAYTFLGTNGYEVEASEEDVVIHTVALAAGDIDEAAYAKWLSRVCVPAES